MASWFSKLFMSRAELDAWERLETFLKTASPSARAFNARLAEDLSQESTAYGKRKVLISAAQDLTKHADDLNRRLEKIGQDLQPKSSLVAKPSVIVSNRPQQKAMETRQVESSTDSNLTNTTNMLLAANLMSSPSPVQSSSRSSCSSDSYSSSSSYDSCDSGGSYDSGGSFD